MSTKRSELDVAFSFLFSTTFFRVCARILRREIIHLIGCKCILKCLLEIFKVARFSEVGFRFRRVGGYQERVVGSVWWIMWGVDVVFFFGGGDFEELWES